MRLQEPIAIAGLAVAAQAEVWAGPGLVAELAANRPQTALFGLAPLALLLRRRAPLVAVVAVAALVAAQGLLVGPGVLVTQIAALLAATYAAAAHLPLRRAVAGWAVAVAGVVAMAAPSGEAGPEIAVFLGAPWLAGRLVRRDRRRALELHALNVELAAERERTARLAVAEERTRIAREVHDVLAHGIGVVALQAAGARRVLPAQPALAAEALEAIEQAARVASGELRTLLDLLRPDVEADEALPLPTLDALPQLVERLRKGGRQVELRAEGEPRRLAPGVDLAAYRIVQEALTNAGRHAPGAAAHVRVRHGAEDVELVVDNEPAPAAAEKNGTGSGHGLVGIRERAALYGGSVEAGPRPDGGFRVRVVLPLMPAVPA